ncbi:MAG: glutaredoxin 3 [Thiomicrorhabdus sp.]|nr:MAG: glutaredoxin 3 [Thiomicrorhabdus sp.]
MAKVVIYSTRSCPYCTMANRLLKSKGVEFQIIDVGGDPSLWTEMETKTGRNTVPQIFIDDFHVGGFDDLSAADKRGELDKLLNT